MREGKIEKEKDLESAQFDESLSERVNESVVIANVIHGCAIRQPSTQHSVTHCQSTRRTSSCTHTHTTHCDAAIPHNTFVINCHHTTRCDIAINTNQSASHHQKATPF